ncbi:hypothetical protein AB1K32_11625 [Metabacillus dongyingensis]|uniref:hypothetical protein n=1 Tax=Metabacillus dongyingensis TaxID=2874282 RepID=UPI003B8DA572
MQQTITTLLGSAGGIARSVLSIFNKAENDLNDHIHPSFLKNLWSLISLSI